MTGRHRSRTWPNHRTALTAVVVLCGATIWTAAELAAPAGGDRGLGGQPAAGGLAPTAESPVGQPSLASPGSTIAPSLGRPLDLPESPPLLTSTATTVPDWSPTDSLPVAAPELQPVAATVFGTTNTSAVPAPPSRAPTSEPAPPAPAAAHPPSAARAPAALSPEAAVPAPTTPPSAAAPVPAAAQAGAGSPAGRKTTAQSGRAGAGWFVERSGNRSRSAWWTASG